MTCITLHCACLAVWLHALLLERGARCFQHAPELQAGIGNSRSMLFIGECMAKLCRLCHKGGRGAGAVHGEPSGYITRLKCRCQGRGILPSFADMYGREGSSTAAG